ncbi:IS5 family transposase [Salinibius halmophilus]|uniref:IS5 family transposase n=1 Tax=Salinibius halmophilus TaxID=1853216 RepID=UPI000E662159|nr:IS5 family transposase [Salinibius halmophilus]
MQQSSLFFQDKTALKLDQLNDPLAKLNEIVDWEDFRADLSEVRKSHDPRKGGRPPQDLVVMFKAIFLRHYYGLSHDQVEFQVTDRLSFRRFLGLGIDQNVPDAKTVWHYEDCFSKTKLLDRVFDKLLAQIEQAGYYARGGTIVDASIIETPKRSSEERLKKRHGVEEDAELPSKVRQQHDPDSRWTKKHNKSYYGYKNHIAIDNEHKIIRSQLTTPANKHDGHELDELVDANNSNGKVYADSAYQSQANEEMLARRGFKSEIHKRNRKTKEGKNDRRIEAGNHTKSKTRVRVEHVFGDIKRHGSKFGIRSVGIARATLAITMSNLVYNVRRFGHLLKHKTPIHRGKCA